jgi:hypothetical protein
MLMFQYYLLDVTTTVVIPIVREGCATRSVSFVIRFATRPYPIVLLLHCSGANHLNCDSRLTSIQTVPCSGRPATYCAGSAPQEWGWRSVWQSVAVFSLTALASVRLTVVVAAGAPGL